MLKLNSQCKICIESKQRIVMLNCGHYFCSDCIETLEKKQEKKSNIENNTDNSIICPMCRTQVNHKIDLVTIKTNEIRCYLRYMNMRNHKSIYGNMRL